MIMLRTHRIALAIVAMSATVALTACSSASPSAAPAAPTAAAPSTSAVALPAGFPVGSWTTTITAEDLEQVDDAFLSNIGMTRDNLVAENSGTFTTTFASDGTWSTVQDTDRPLKWPVFRGSFKPIGEDAMEQVTTFPPDFAGDVVRFTWRLEDGELHLGVTDPPDPILPVVMEAHPWKPAG
jgi:hypothetical protein